MNLIKTLAVGFGLTWVIAACAQDLYNGQPLANSDIQIAPFGSGKIEETNEVALNGNSFKTTFFGLHGGGWIAFQRGRDISQALQQPGALMKVALRLPVEQASGSSRPMTLSKIRIVIETTDGKLTESLHAIDKVKAANAQWYPMAVPLSAIPDLARSNGIVKRIGISGDARSTVYIGEISVATDSTPIQGYFLAVINGVQYDSRQSPRIIVASNDEILLYAFGDGGSSPLVYEWNLMSGNPAEVDASGATLRHRFPKAGEYTITLTIKDGAGRKQPATVTLKMTIT